MLSLKGLHTIIANGKV